jgi:hypothetical protein
VWHAPAKIVFCSVHEVEFCIYHIQSVLSHTLCTCPSTTFECSCQSRSLIPSLAYSLPCTACPTCRGSTPQLQPWRSAGFDTAKIASLIDFLHLAASAALCGHQHMPFKQVRMILPDPRPLAGSYEYVSSTPCAPSHWPMPPANKADSRGYSAGVKLISAPNCRLVRICFVNAVCALPLTNATCRHSNTQQHTAEQHL